MGHGTIEDLAAAETSAVLLQKIIHVAEFVFIS